jgi:hypothetical protein
MSLGPGLLKLLRQRYEPSATIDLVYKGRDLTFRTDDQGNPVLVFIGKRDEHGKIKGERHARTLLFDASGTPVKDHWELKGRAS